MLSSSLTRVDFYDFAATLGDVVTIQMTSDVFGTALSLVNPSGVTVETDSSLSVLSYLIDSTGTWRIIATSWQPNSLGRYSLSLQCSRPVFDDPNCGETGTLTCPLTVRSAALTTSDCALDDGSFFDTHQFAGVPGTTVVIDMIAGFDTFLFLYNPLGELVDQNDDFAGATHSRIVRTISMSGSWRILANSFHPNVTAPYTLTLICLGGPSPTPTPTPAAPGPSEIPTLGVPVLGLLAFALAAGALALIRRLP